MKRTHSMDLLFGLLLFGLFTVLLLLVLSSGVGAYRSVERSMAANHDQRTAVSYLATKIRHYDAQAAVEVEQLGGLPALRLRETLDGAPYSTWIYVLDGQLTELFAEDDNQLPPESGSAVLPLAALEIIQEDGLLAITCTGGDGRRASLRLCLRTGEEVGP